MLQKPCGPITYNKRVPGNVTYRMKGIALPGDESNGPITSYEPIPRPVKEQGSIGGDRASSGMSCVVRRPEYRGSSGIVVGCPGGVRGRRDVDGNEGMSKKKCEKNKSKNKRTE